MIIILILFQLDLIIKGNLKDNPKEKIPTPTFKYYFLYC